MTFAVPKDLKHLNSLMTPSVLPIELNDTDVDRMLTGLMELAVKRGRRTSSKTDVRDFAGYLASLQHNPALVGFGDDESRELLQGWLRAAVLRFERRGLTRSTTQMGYFEPLTLASYRGGLPKTVSRNRRADQLALRSMTRVLASRGAENPEAHVAHLFVGAFGRGVELGQYPHTSPAYDGATEIDITTLLALRFLEGFEGNNNPKKVEDAPPPPVPWAADPLGEDVIDLLTHYSPVMSVGESFVHLSALLSLRLFQLPLITAAALKELRSGSVEVPVTNPLELYCDFVGRAGSRSDETARACVRRDLQTMASLFSDRLLFRTVEQASAALPDLRVDGTEGWDRLVAIADRLEDERIEMALGIELGRLEHDLDEDSKEFLSELRSAGLSNRDALLTALVEGLRRQRGLENQVKWFWSTGAISKSYGLLKGSLKHRTTWRYAPSDECLTSMLCMVFVETGGRRVLGELSMGQVLQRLRERFGVLIDTPPADLDSADSRSGAAENLAAFTRRLQLIGCFQGLSDDFDAQIVTRPREAAK